MTYAPVQNQTRYRSYQDYLDDDSLSPEGNYRLLSTGELIEVAEEDDLNVRIIYRLIALFFQLEDGLYIERVRNGNKEVQVRPVGDRRVNRKPDFMVLHAEHLETSRQAILLDALPPLFVAEVVSPGGKTSENFKRDYIWKRRQYEEMGIPEYWIIDPHREQITVLVLAEEAYKETVHAGDDLIQSVIFPDLNVVAKDLLKR